MRDCASAYVNAARLRMTLFVNWLDTTCDGGVCVCVCVGGGVVG